MKFEDTVDLMGQLAEHARTGFVTDVTVEVNTVMARPWMAVCVALILLLAPILPERYLDRLVAALAQSVGWLVLYRVRCARPRWVLGAWVIIREKMPAWISKTDA